jgi:hypothetical protein
LIICPGLREDENLRGLVIISANSSEFINVEAAYNTTLARSTYLAALSKRGYTAERKAAVKALKTWWDEFYATAQVALKDRPELLGFLDA